MPVSPIVDVSAVLAGLVAYGVAIIDHLAAGRHWRIRLGRIPI